MNAARFGSKMIPGKRVAWNRLERAAFEHHPAVVTALRATGVKGQSQRKMNFFLPLIVLVGIFYAAPIWGMATVLGPVALSQTSRVAEGDIKVGSIIFMFAFVFVVGHAILWLATGRKPRSALLGSAGVAFAFGGVSALVTVRRGFDNAVPAWELWILPMAATAVVGGLFFFLVFYVNRTDRRAKKTPQRPVHFRETEAYTEPIREAILLVSAADQRRIREDLSVAIDDLERRQVISSGRAAEARTAPLGGLAVHMLSLEAAQRAAIARHTALY